MTDLPAVVAHPETGEVLEHLDQQPPELLAHALAVVQARQAELVAAAKAVEGELRNRLKILDRTSTTFGEWKVSAKPRNTRVWSVEDLRGVLDDLVARGVIQAGEIPDGIIVRREEVAGKVALELRGQLGADGQAAIDKAYRWRSERGPLTVARKKPAEEARPLEPAVDAAVRERRRLEASPEAGDAEQHKQQDEKHDHVDEQVQRVGSHDTGSTRPPVLDPEELFA
jgi:hypothetical protein